MASTAKPMSGAGQPIGVFDSGVGGLSILRAVRSALPAEELIYVADTGYLPYGEKPVAFIQQRATAISEFLQARGAKAILVACNTATATAIDHLRQRFELPFIGVEPAVKPAAALTRSGVIGVLATGATTASVRLGSLLQRFASGVEVIVQPCPGLVEKVEAAQCETAETLALVQSYVAPLVARGADTLVLGCTHYPFLEPAIRAAAGDTGRLLDTGEPVARGLARRLDALGIARNGGRGGETFWTSGTPQAVAAMVGRLWGDAVEVRSLPC
jgi:glutamate racemase